MTDKRLFLALAPAALLASCGEQAEEGAGASGEVLEGTISDAMLPVDRVRSEAPLEDPEAFAEARSGLEGEEEGEAANDAEGEAADAVAGAADETPDADSEAEADAEE